jgi:hypothetical protein
MSAAANRCRGVAQRGADPASAAGGVRGTGEQRPPTLAPLGRHAGMLLCPSTTCTTARRDGNAHCD